jgi:hypothetical protein
MLNTKSGASTVDTAVGALDAIAFLAFAVLIGVTLVIIVFLGQLPGRIARQRGHPQAAAINVTGWLGLATLGLLWPMVPITRGKSSNLHPAAEKKLNASRSRIACMIF